MATVYTSSPPVASWRQNWHRGFVLRDYQRIAARQCIELLREHHTLLVMPTGTGKTRTACAIARGLYAPGRPVLTVAHTGEILRQLASAFAGWHVHLEKATDRAQPDAVVRSSYDGPTVLLASQQTLARKYRLDAWRDVDFACRILDEAHHTPASTWQAVREAIAGPWLGLTATPQRPGMAQLWRVVQPFPALEDAIDAGWLVPARLRYMQIDADERKALGRSPLGDVEAARARVVRTALRWCGDRQGLCFWATVAAAKAGAALMHATGIVAIALHGGSRDRATAIERYRAGEVRWLHLCAVGVEGMDVVPASALVLASPRRGWQLTQILGRVLRPLPGAVEHAAASDRRDAIALSTKADALVLSATEPDDMDAAIEAQALLNGPLPKPRLIQLVQAAAVDPEAREAQELLAREIAESVERRERGRARQLQPRRRRQVNEAQPYAVSGGSDREYYRAKWAEWRTRGVGIDGPRATPKQAEAIGRMLCRALGQPDGTIDTSEVTQWPQTVARSAHYWLFRRTR